MSKWYNRRGKEVKLYGCMLEIGSGALRMVLKADIVIIIHGETEIN